MCGIAGIIGRRAGEAELLQMLRTMERRGDPELFGETRVVLGFAFGSNRLAIMDPDHGRQPYSTDSGSAMCVQNGEIYNHTSLRVQLSTEFRSSCDTETLLHAWLRWRSGLLNRVDGMYGAAFADLESGDWMLARDPLGIKPLYWTTADDSVFFASEIKGLVTVCGNAPIHELPPGSVLSANGISRIVELPRFAAEGPDDSAALTLIRSELTHAVKSHLPPGGQPIAALLSGGVDSSTILYLMGQLHDGPIEAFTLATDQGNSPDLQAAKCICDQLDIRLTVVSPSANALSQFYIEHGVAMTETFEPALVRNATSYHFLCRAVRAKGYKLCLSGEGADEVFGGYDYFKKLPTTEVDSAIQCALSNVHRTYLLMADRASMYARLEVRVPYMDYRFVSAAASVGSSARLRDRTDKWVLRNLFLGELPEVNRTRAKVGMNAGAGFGPNDPGEGIYAEAVQRYYRDAGGFDDDLRVAQEHASLFGLDSTNIEEVYNFSRYLQHGFTCLTGCNERPQLNTMQVKPLSALTTSH